MAKRGPKVMVLGLDGATLDLIRPWATEGKLPHLARLMAEGAWGELESTIPPVTAPAWISFMTGQSPASHGIFHFRTFDLTKYSCFDETLVTSAAIAGKTIFDRASEAGLRVAAVNVPMTYPPYAVNGVMVAGYPTPNVQKAYTYPPELARGIGVMNVTSEFFRHSNPERIRSAQYMVENLTGLCERLLREEVYDLLAVVYTNTDMANHFFRKYMDPSLPAYDPEGAKIYGRALEEQYRLVDQAVGRLLALRGPDTTVVVMSDHGSGPYATQYVHLNAWLREEGWLATRDRRIARTGQAMQALLEYVRIRTPFLRDALKRYLPNAVKEQISRGRQNAGAIDWLQTSAYRVPMAFYVDGVEINLQGRQREGAVAPQEYDAVRGAIIERLADLRDPRTGERIVRRVLRKEEAYGGKGFLHAPDLVVFFDPRYAGGGGILGEVVTPIPHYFLETWSGQHRMEGTLILWGPHVRRGEPVRGANIVDLAPTILHLLGLPLPDDLDGRFLAEAFEPEYLTAHPIRTVGAAGPRDTSRQRALTEEEEREMKEALRGLGYLS